MFVLDTNILSAMMHVRPVPEVTEWIAGQDEGRLFTTTISHAEIFSGLAVMTEGRRRRDLEEAARAMFDEFNGRLLPFDIEAATAYAVIFADRRRMGRPGTTLDLMIASVARSLGASVVTRDIGGFEGCGVPLIDPWALS